MKPPNPPMGGNFSRPRAGIDDPRYFPAYLNYIRGGSDDWGGELSPHLPLSPSKLDEEGQPTEAGLCPVLAARAAGSQPCSLGRCGLRQRVWQPTG
jgi:hypothetical protein